MLILHKFVKCMNSLLTNCRTSSATEASEEQKTADATLSWLCSPLSVPFWLIHSAL